ncbi:hypothetical protein GN956_G15009 [Arapaima gigas]
MWGRWMRLLALFLGFCVLLSAHLCQKPNEEHFIVVKTNSNSVFLSLPSMPPSGFTQVVWKKDNKMMAKAKNISNPLTYSNANNLFSNGTLLLSRPDKADGGLFEVEIFSDSGACMFWGSIRLEVQDPVSKPVLSLISWHNGTTSLRCDVQQDDKGSIQWGRRPCGTNTSWDLVTGSLTLFVESTMAEEFICTAVNNISQDTSNTVTVGCQNGTPPEIFQNSGDQPTKKGTAREHIIILLLCICGSLLITVSAFVVLLSIIQKPKKSGIIEKKEETSHAVGDVQLLDTMKEEEYVDMCLETTASAAAETSGSGSKKAPCDAQEPDTEDVYVPMTTAKNTEETVPASETSQSETRPSGQEQGSTAGSNKQVVYAEVNFLAKKVSSWGAKQVPQPP